MTFHIERRRGKTETDPAEASGNVPDLRPPRGDHGHCFGCCSLPDLKTDPEHLKRRKAPETGSRFSGRQPSGWNGREHDRHCHGFLGLSGYVLLGWHCRSPSPAFPESPDCAGGEADFAQFPYLWWYGRESAKPRNAGKIKREESLRKSRTKDRKPENRIKTVRSVKTAQNANPVKTAKMM